MTRNFLVHSLEIGAEWKHAPAGPTERTWNGEPWRFVLCVKNPYAWLVSCFRYFRQSIGADATVPAQFVGNAAMPFEEFVMAPSYEFPSPVHRWNQMYRLWLDTLPAYRTVVVLQEDQLSDQLAVLARAQGKLGLTALGALTGIDRRVDVNATLGAAMNRNYYLEGRYMGSYSADLLRRVNRVLDSEMMARFEYAFESR